MNRKLSSNPHLAAMEADYYRRQENRRLKAVNDWCNRVQIRCERFIYFCFGAGFMSIVVAAVVAAIVAGIGK